MPIEAEAAVLRAFGEPLVLERVELRDPGPGEVRVRLLAAGVCHSDVGQADGEWSHPLPVVLGHEGCGVVESVGEGVSGVTVGERVVLNLAPGCARCSHCLQGRPILCQDALEAMGEGRLLTGPSPILGSDGPIATYSLLGCFATHAVVSERSVIPVPSAVPAPVAALIGCAVITGVGAATETLDIRAGTRGAVIGVGGVGGAAIQGARLRGAAEIAAFDLSPARLEAARRVGATETIDARDEELLERLRGRARRDGFDWAIVTVGRPEAIRLGVDLTRPGATTAVVGLTPESVETGIDMLELVTFEKRIVGSAFGSLSPALLVPRIARLSLEGRLELDLLASEPLPLEAINEAFERSRRADGPRPVLAISAEGT